jgi:hypothetical protein
VGSQQGTAAQPLGLQVFLWVRLWTQLCYSVDDNRFWIECLSSYRYQCISHTILDCRWNWTDHHINIAWFIDDPFCQLSPRLQPAETTWLVQFIHTQMRAELHWLIPIALHLIHSITRY